MILLILPLAFVFFILDRPRTVPGRPAHLLDDDEPLDGRAGDRHAPADAEDRARARQALVADAAEDRAAG